MDYKEIIEAMRSTDLEVVFCSSIAAADAIEILLAERDAAVEELAGRPRPSTCKHGEHCDYISVITGRPDCYSCDEWQWRGPQKGDGHGDQQPQKGAPDLRNLPLV